MRKQKAVAGILAAAAVLAAGCAPGQIREYASRAQQAGKAAFGNEAAPVMEEGGAAETPLEEEIADAVQESSAQAGGGETAPAESAALENETAAVSEGEAGASKEAVEDEAIRMQDWPGMMRQPSERIREAWAQDRAVFAGHLAGMDRLNGTEQAALSAVLEQKSYGDKTLCLQNSARYDNGEYGSFLILFDSQGYLARGRVKGDLWYYGSRGARQLLEDVSFLRVETVQEDGGNWFLIHTQDDGVQHAGLYEVSGGACSVSFEDASSVSRTADGLCVMYTPRYFSYDPATGGWTEGFGQMPAYYTYDKEKGFVPQQVRALTAEEYLSYIRPEASDTEGQEFLQTQRDLFYDSVRPDGEYAYTFFAVGDSRVGYRERRIGKASDARTGEEKVTAEYRYAIRELEGGKLTPLGPSLSGEGYWLCDPQNPEDELAALNDLPAELLERRIGLAADFLRPGELEALERVRQAEKYPVDGVVFADTADYDGDGTQESFVAAGEYDGAFGAPVCDLWYVTESGATLLKESLPIQDVSRYGLGKTSLYLLEGYGIGGAGDVLYCVWEGQARQLLEGAGRIEVSHNGDLTAWDLQEGDRPSYYFYSEGTAAQYPLRTADAEKLLEFDNGQAVYDSLLLWEPERIDCVRYDNGVWEVTAVLDNGAAFYQILEEREQSLVLTGCGEGSGK